jgi:hypothetical protein
MLDEGVARELGLMPYQRRSAVLAGRYTTARAIVPEMRVGDLVMRDVAVGLIPQQSHEKAGIKVVGLLGFDFLAELGVTIDYEHQRIVAIPGGEFLPPVDPRAILVDVRIGNGVPEATVSMNGAVGERWIIDTGGIGTFLIFNNFARRHSSAIHDEGAGSRARVARLVGIGGEFAARPYQIAHLKLGAIDLHNAVGYRVATSGNYDGATDGLICNDFLRLFTIRLDYGGSRLYLTPNAAGLAAEER